MKKLFAVLIIPAISLFMACSGSAHKTTDDKTDTNTNKGTSAASDTINGSAAPFAESTAGTDTSTDGHGIDDPLADTVKPKKHHK